MIELRFSDRFKALVHKSLLCHYSSYYDAAINGGFQEASNASFELDLIEEQAKCLVSWLYSGSLGTHLSRPDMEQLFFLYIFADETDILAPRRHIMTMLVKEEKTGTSFRLLAMVINSLPPSDPLYRFVMCFYAHHWTPSRAELSQEDPFHEELSIDVWHEVVRLLAMNHSERSRCACCNHPCTFHHHKGYHEWHSTCFTFAEVPESLRT